MLSLGWVGFGWWGQVLANSVAGSSDKVRVAKVTTRHVDAIVDAATKMGAETVESYEAMLADPGIDAVVLATPHTVHLDQIERAAKAGKHIFVEKPITLTPDDARRAFDVAKAAGVILAVGHNRRFHPSTLGLAELVRSEKLGTIVNIEANMSAPGLWMYKEGSWRQSREEQPAGGMTGMAIHLIDTIIMIAGQVDRVRAESVRLVKSTDLDETTSIQMHLESGAPAYIGTSIATNLFYGVRVFGTDGWAEIRNADLSSLEFSPRGGTPEVTTTPGFDTTHAELEAFADAINGVAPYPVPEDEVVHGIAVMDAAIRSAESGGIVEVR